MSLLAGLRQLLRRRGRQAAPAAPAPDPFADPARAEAATIDFSAPTVARNPFPYWEALRRAGPVQYLPMHGGWIVLGYEAVKAALAQPEIFSNAPYGEIDSVLLGADPPRHGPVRRIVSRHFTADGLKRLEATAARTVAGLDRPRLDAVEHFAKPVSRAVAAELIGFDEAALGEIAAAAAPLAALISALDRAAPRSAIYPLLLRDAGGQIGEAEARSLVRLLWLAATTTTERVLARSLLCLVEDEALQARIRGDRRFVPALVEEAMRLHPPEHVLPRLARRAASLEGIAIPEGAIVYICVGAANRDPAQFDAPAQLRLDRPSKRHFAFGSGIHHCVGAPLARRVATTAVAALLDRSHRLRPLEALERLPYFASMTALSPDRLEIGL